MHKFGNYYRKAGVELEPHNFVVPEQEPHKKLSGFVILHSVEQEIF
jgi:hypothetical protein